VEYGLGRFGCTAIPEQAAKELASTQKKKTDAWRAQKKAANVLANDWQPPL
jgi:hypothetical protein